MCASVCARGEKNLGIWKVFFKRINFIYIYIDLNDRMNCVIM